MNRVALRQALTRHFNEEELSTLCFDLGIDYESLEGKGKEAKARELIAYYERRGLTRELEAKVRALRPRIPTHPQGQISDFLLKGYPNLDELIRKSSRIRILASSLSSTSSRYYDAFSTFLQQGGTLKVLVSDTTPEVLAMQVYRSASLKDAEAIKGLIQGHIGMVKALAKRTGFSGSFQFRSMPYLPPYSIALFEPSSGTATAYVKLLAFQQGEANQPTMEVTNEGDSEWFDYFSNQFDRMWEGETNRLI
jgi:hypothetical protein